MTDESPAARIDTSVSHSARVWNYWLGGKDNYPVDRQASDRVAEMYPDIVQLARAARGFLTRAVRFLAAEAGIGQFLDIGTGLPTASNTHQVAQAIAPRSRVVYVDNDPLVLAHARALLTSSPEGACDYIDADLRDPGEILAGASRTLDLTAPVAKPPVILRSPGQIAGFFDGLELLEPGVVSTPRWRPDAVDIGGEPRDVDQFCAVGRKP